MRMPAYSSVITTTGSKIIDQTNSLLIQVCRDNSIPSLGFLDHWKGFDRFFDNYNKPSYMPDWLGVIDQKQKVDWNQRISCLQVYSSLVILGDFLKQKNKTKANSMEAKSILLVYKNH